MAASDGRDIFSLKTFCLVTGASRGLGQCMAIRFAEKLPAQSMLVLMARSLNGLESTSDQIAARASHVRTKVVQRDLSSQTETSLDALLRGLFEELKVAPRDFDQALLVHNAATLGDVSKMMTEIDSASDLNAYWDMNLTSPLLLNTVFFRHFTQDVVDQRVVINITSLCSIKPFKSWSIYCAGKAARDMLFNTMAAEDSSIRVLSYAPGPIDTEMQVLARRDTADDDLRQMFIGMKSEGTLLSCDQSIDRLVPLLQKNKFQSGAHLDYYDI
ncbi:hypothetical protein CAPTEDRAFT_18220 [Capitella teleta]|uniref:Sepiapterin reductase n=1 Tax=Capitella teleta TaxID=283909 RepID=R7TN56_CAPTE|nr:hypothetical protein CAPTEDRAFT_18220 [Capitella teleta]|eukprot:ELT92986.1 hypothetical protein CAPTEDRAFT_18220 [Capitella teleta]